MLRFVDPGGRLYGNVGASYATLLSYWTSQASFNSAGAWSVAAGGGRVSGSCLRFAYPSGNNVYAFLTKSLGEAHATWGAALAYKFNGLPGGASTMDICSFFDGGTPQVTLRVRPDGLVEIARGIGGGSVSLGVSSVAVNQNAWNHYEFKVTIGTSGTIELRINGVTRIGPLTGVNTRATANSSASMFQLGTGTSVNGFVNSEQFDFDDVIVYDGAPTDANGLADINDFVGDCGLTVLRPSAAGNLAQFAPIGAASNHVAVNEITPDGDTSCVESATVGDTDTYQLDNLPGSTTAVKALAAIYYARKTDVGLRVIRSVLRTASTNYPSGAEIALGNSYAYYTTSWGKNPNTAGAWDIVAVNGLEAGQKVSA